jgi:hypothetical protein
MAAADEFDPLHGLVSDAVQTILISHARFDEIGQLTTMPAVPYRIRPDRTYLTDAAEHHWAAAAHGLAGHLSPRIVTPPRRGVRC